jgi:oleate hydratase
MEVMNMKKDYGNQQAYFVGGGLASLAGAVYLVRDCGFSRKKHSHPRKYAYLGGSNDGPATQPMALSAAAAEC